MGAAAAAVVGTLVATIGRVLMKTLTSRELASLDNRLVAEADLP